MSEQHLNLLRQKISEVESVLNEITNLQESISQDKGLLQIEQQLLEINKAINNLQASQTPVPDELRELKNKITNDLVVKSEADKIFNLFIESLRSFINNSPLLVLQTNRSRSTRLDTSETIKLVLMVLNLVAKDGMKVSKAFTHVAQIYNINVISVRNKCTEQIGLDLKTFKTHVEFNNPALVKHLLKKFPQHVSLIQKLTQTE